MRGNAQWSTIPTQLTRKIHRIKRIPLCLLSRRQRGFRTVVFLGKSRLAPKQSMSTTSDCSALVGSAGRTATRTQCETQPLRRAIRRRACSRRASFCRISGGGSDAPFAGARSHPIPKCLAAPKRSGGTACPSSCALIGKSGKMHENSHLGSFAAVSRKALVFPALGQYTGRRSGGRVVEGTPLLRVQARKGLEGSNPFHSATYFR